MTYRINWIQCCHNGTHLIKVIIKSNGIAKSGWGICILNIRLKICSQNKLQENEVCCSALNRNSAFNMCLNYLGLFMPSPNLQNGVDITIIRPHSDDGRVEWYGWSPWDGAWHTARFSTNVCRYRCYLLRLFSTEILNRHNGCGHKPLLYFCSQNHITFILSIYRSGLCVMCCSL